MKKWVGRIILLVIVAAVIGGVVYSMRPKPVVVDAVEVGLGPMRVSVTGEGTTRVEDRYVVMASVHGNLARIELKPGDTITEATVLARIEPTAPPLLDARQRDELEARAQAAAAASRQATSTVSRAETAASFAQNELARAKELFAQGAMSNQAFDAAQLELETTTKDLDSARFAARVARYESQMARAAAARATDRKGGKETADNQLEILSPIEGQILRILRESEGIVAPGAALMEVADPTALEIVVDVLTAEAVEVSTSDPVTITQWGGEQALRGHVSRIEPAAFTKVSALGVEEQRVNVIIDLDDPPTSWARLGDGFRVEVDITVWHQENVLKLPLSALFREGDTWSVFTIEGERAVAKPIEVARRNDFEVQVASGVEPGQRVILHPSDSIGDGSLVEAR